MTIEGGIRNNTMMERETAHIVIVARSGTLYQCLAHTLQEQLSGYQVLICEAGSLPDAGAEGDVRLILIHSCCSAEIAREVEMQRELHPAAAIAILVDDAETLAVPCHELFAARKVQGILSMTLKLEVWLATVLLLLSGGEYYPVEGRRQPSGAAVSPPGRAGATAQAKPAESHSENQPARSPYAENQPSGNHYAEIQPAESRATPSLPPLTVREREILELLSEGHQNKLIAHKMSLSEHTVKVHVHNLLSKLRVSNRTQAAATYRRDMTAALRLARGLSGGDTAQAS